MLGRSRVNGERDRAKARVLLEREERNKVGKEQGPAEAREGKRDQPESQEREGSVASRDEEQGREEGLKRSQTNGDGRSDPSLPPNSDMQVKSSPFISPSPPQLVLPSVGADSNPRTQSDAATDSGQAGIPAHTGPFREPKKAYPGPPG